jgi:hypothetical protein
MQLEHSSYLQELNLNKKYQIKRRRKKEKHYLEALIFPPIRSYSKS